MNRRGLRLELVAGLSIALAMPALALAAENSQGLTTQTTLTTETRDQGGRTQATVQVTVTGEDGLPASGAVAIEDQGKQLAGVVLNAEGQAKTVLALPAGRHALRATYAGDATHQVSVSSLARVQALAAATPDFAVAVSPATVSLTAGQSMPVTVSVTPSSAPAANNPMFVTLSCSGLPDQSSCTFTPENVEILTAGAVTSSMVIETQAKSLASATPAAQPHSSPVAWAILLPGVLGLGGLAWGARRRRWMNRFSLLALVALVSTLGTTACAPLYNYKNHGPTPNLPTPAGTYTVTITAQSTNGITAVTHNTTMALTVK
jgi:hypothetical protein